MRTQRLRRMDNAAMHSMGRGRPGLRGGAARARVAFVVCVGVALAGCGSGGRSPSPSAAISPSPVSPTPPFTAAPIASASDTPAASPTAEPSASPSSPTPSASPEPAIPNFDHIYVIILENKEYGRIVGSAQAPYENGLIAKYGLATHFLAETHPSEPNYIALTSGGLQGTHSDASYNLNVPNLFDQIEASGRTWRVYAQGYPGNCYKTYIGPIVADGPGAPGEYVRKHNAAISYTSISGNPTRCANIVKLAGFDPAAADFEMIIPNQINDMHSSSVAAGDAFLKLFVPSIIDSPAFQNSVLFITFDEGDSNVGGGGHIATIICSPGMKPGTKFDTLINHYSMLRTIEQAWGLPYLGQAAAAPPIDIGY